MKRLLLCLCLMCIPATAGEVIVPVKVHIQTQSVMVPIEIISRAENETIGPMDCIRIWLDVPNEGVPTIKWGCHPVPKLIQVGRTIDDGRPFLVFQAGAVGSFGLFVSSYHDAENHLRKYEIITEGENGPDPPQPPTPTPAPPPGKRMITVIEQNPRTPSQAAILTSKTLRAYLKSKGHTLTITDVDALTGNVPSNLPQLRIADGEGNEIFRGPLPATVDTTLETIKVNGG